MTGPGSCARLTWRRLLWGLVAAVAVVAMPGACALPASAQSQLTLADFDAAGRDADLLALIETGSAASGAFTTLYQASPGVGSLVDGELGVGASNSALTKIEWRGDTVNDLRVQNGSDLDLSAYFGTGGAGADLTLRVQTSGGTGTGALQSSGASVARWDKDAGGKAILDGLSGGDRPIIALTRAGTPPAQVTNVVATAASDTSIELSWDAAARADGYRVQWGTTSGVYTGSADTTDTAHTITGLTANTTYYLRVISTRTQVDDGDPSAEVSATTMLSPPTQVTGVSVGAVSHDSLTFSWNAVAGAIRYATELSVSPEFTSHETISGVGGTSETFSGLREGTIYHVRVRASKTGAPDGPYSAVVSATTTLQPPAQVTGVSATPTSDTEINVTWSLAVRAGGYRLEWGTASGNYSGSATTTALSHPVPDLTADTGYYFRVTATRAGTSDGPPSAEAVSRTNPPPPPSPPAGVTAEAISDREIRVQWQEALNATGYIVQWDLGSGFPNPLEATVVGTGAIIEDLRSETEYFVRVIGTRAGATDSAPSAADAAITHQAPVKTWSDRFPCGPVGAQLALSLFAGLMAGVRVRSDKTPQREVKIVVVMCAASLILPAFGTGNVFWTGGIVLLVMVATGAVYFLARR